MAKSKISARIPNKAQLSALADAALGAKFVLDSIVDRVPKVIEHVSNPHARTMLEVLRRDAQAALVPFNERPDVDE